MAEERAKEQHGAIGVCSWSLRPESPGDLAAKVRACGLKAVQLALDPIRRNEWDEVEVREALDEEGIAILSGMMAMEGEDYSTLESIRATGGVRPAETAERNLEAAKENAAIAQRMGLSLVTFHAGCVPEDAADPLHDAMLTRLRDICGAFGDEGVSVAFETGQDSPATLIGVLDALDDLGVGVNFDPANMLLYGSADPIEALRQLAKWVKQAHIKDAKRSAAPGQWGEEVAAGKGEVDWPRFFEALRERAPGVDLVIERESGESRVEDVALGLQLVRRLR